MYLPDEFALLKEGISRIGSFIHSERYTLDTAIVNAAKAAYLAKLIENGRNDIRHYNPEKAGELNSKNISLLLLTKLNKLKKTHPEAFFYCHEISEL